MKHYVLIVSYETARGMIAAISTFLADYGCNIIDSSQFHDLDTGKFFMRVSFRSETGAERGALSEGLKPIADKLGMVWEIFDAAERMKVLLTVSRFGHCLNDLIYRRNIGALPIDIIGVVSNNLDYQKFVVNNDIPFHHIRVTKDNKVQAEAQLMEIVESTGTELIVLARYMQAYQRGVKLIGASADYVTADLDEGPIIEQDKVRITHGKSAGDYTSLGRDVEAQVLADIHQRKPHRRFSTKSRQLCLRTPRLTVARVIDGRDIGLR